MEKCLTERKKKKRVRELVYLFIQINERRKAYIGTDSDRKDHESLSDKMVEIQ